MASFIPPPHNGPRLIAMHFMAGWGDTTAGVPPGVFAAGGLEKYLNGSLDPSVGGGSPSHDLLLALGVRYFCFMWSKGNAPARGEPRVGRIGADYPGEHIELFCSPLSEVRHRALVGSQYLDQFLPALDTSARKGQSCGYLFYDGCAEDGWTGFHAAPSTEAHNTMILYVDPDNGNDATARPYDPSEVGQNPFAPAITPLAYKTYDAAYAAMRDGYPDWMLGKRGTTYVGNLPDWKKSGRSSIDRMLIGAYGTGARPVISYGLARAGLQIYSNNLAVAIKHLAVVSMEFVPHVVPSADDDPKGVMIFGQVEDVLLDDVVSRDAWKNYDFENVGDGLGHNFHPKTITLNRCHGWDAIDPRLDNPSVTCANLYAGGVDGLILRECLFDRAGYDHASKYRHNVYIQGDCTAVEAYDCISARGWIAWEQRAGGTCTGNLSLDCSFHFVLGNGTAPMVSRYLVCLDSHDIDTGDPDLNLGQGIQASSGGGSNSYSITKFVCMRRTPAAAYNVAALSIEGTVNDCTFQDGVVRNWAQGGNGSGVFVGGTPASGGVRFVNVDLQQTGGGQAFVDFANVPLVITGGRHWSTSTSPYQTVNTPQTFAVFLAAHPGMTATFTEATYPDPDRSVETYMASKGRPATLAAFMAMARAQSREGGWDYNWSARAVGDYIRAGLGMDQVEDAELDAHSATAVALEGEEAFDVQSSLDFTDATLRHRRFLDRRFAQGTRTYGESWEQLGVPSVAGWLSIEKGIWADPSRGSFALANPSAWYTPAALAPGQRPIISIAATSTPEDRWALARVWLGTNHCDVVLDFSGFSQALVREAVAFWLALGTSTNPPPAVVIAERRRNQIRDVRDFGSARAALDRIASSVQPTPVVRLAAGAQSGLTRRVTLTVADMQGQAWKRRRPVHVHFSLGEWGEPGGAQTLALVRGTVLAEVAVGSVLTCLCDGSGVIELDVTVPAAGTRYVHAEAGGEMEVLKVVWA